MKKPRKKVLSVMGIIIILGIIYVAFLQYKISEYNQEKVPNNAEYLIVLGARVKGTIPSLAFASRIDAAAEYLKKNEKAIVIASGGKGPGEDISEAETVKRELVSHGIDKSRIFLEDQSTNTNENIQFSKKLLPSDAKLGLVVTNTFHIYRAVSLARDQGLDVEGLPAKTPAKAILKSYIREYLAITKYYLVKYIF
ncbi:YdcF family protein [Neobacillus mesonae]|uniref:Cytoplasmic protein n=1 Tax=Neobacillus mesonae TaxID=1193713 RepID=A0A3T0HXM1_9BACI|nr:YdcF family protein [Neobacillus mesonae]AZU61757.1 cytoplasmic protein [Neobacillus mesonae]